MHRFSKEYIRKQNFWVTVVVIVLIVLGLGVHSYFNYSLKPVAADSHQTVKVVIPKNCTDREVAAILKRRGLVRSQYVFYYYLQTHKTHGLKAGTFYLHKSLSIQELTAHLQESQHAKKK